MNKKCFLVLCMVCMVLFGCSSKENNYYPVDDTEAVSEATEQVVPSTEEASADEGIISVYICGQVNNPGVYELESGARITDAIQLAGGFTPEASEDYWNLAELLVDGQMIYVPSVDENLESDGAEVTSDSSTQSSTNDDGKININTASKEELVSIPGIGESRAQSIIEYREEHGGFSSIDEITAVSGIGDALFQKMRDCIRIN